ncbi:hypothetical protein HY357_00805 [Candidatus Roizmanbacteria bacterium]|nr:hypothetical protein [Candidatus Roizmanbacteria bacterium]
MEDRKLLKTFKNVLPFIFLITSAVLSRILPHPPNFAPVAGLALFSGAYLSGFGSFAFPLIIMIFSDMILGFHSTLLYVYGSFLLIVFIGKLLREKKSFRLFVGASFISSLLFFLITNFGVWMSTNMYSKDLWGLFQAYVMGIPFFKNTILGDLFYTLTLFYGFKFITLISQRLLFSLPSQKKSS